MGVGAELEEIERNSLVRSVSWELDGETNNTTEQNMYTHNGSWELQRNQATVITESCFVTVVSLSTFRLESRSSKLEAPSLDVQSGSCNHKY